MATSSTSSSQAAGSAIETGGGGGNITGGGNASINFESAAPARQQEAVQTEPQQDSAVGNIAAQSIGESRMMQQATPRQQEKTPIQEAAPQARMVAQGQQQPAMQQAQGGNLVSSAVSQQQLQANAAPQAQAPAVRQLQSNDMQVRPPQQQVQEQSRSKFPNAPIAEKGVSRPERFDQKMKDRESFFNDISGRTEIRQEGVVEKPEPINMVSHANRRFKKSKQFIQDKINNVIKRKGHYSGTSFYETLFSKPDLMPHCVSIGDENLLDSLREPNSMLLQLVNDKLAEKGQKPLDAESCMNDMRIMVDAINSLDIEVTLEKTPVNVNNSIQVRVLRAHHGRGIGLHPTQTKAYNADYDGDNAVLNLDQANIGKYSRAMTRLVDIEGNPTIDPDFFPLDPIDDSQRADVRKELDYYSIIWRGHYKFMEPVFNAYVDACNKGDWVGLLRSIDNAFSKDDVYTGLSQKNHEQEVARILKSLYDFSVDRRGLSLETQFSELVEHSNYNPPDVGFEPFVYDLVDMVDEIVAGRPAPNFEDFNRVYNKYYGDVRGNKNVPFRLLADFAKAINRSEMLQIGDGVFGVNFAEAARQQGIDREGGVNEPSEITVYQFWQFTCAAAMSKQISGRMHMGSRQLAVSTQVRTMVTRECPIPIYDVNQNTLPIEDQFRKWIRDFIESYNHNMRMLSVSQVSFRSGMAPVFKEKFKGIDERTYDGLDKALVEVYGNKTIEAVFPGIVFTAGKENTSVGVARHYRYMSLESFSVNNRVSFRSERTSSQSVPKKNAIANRIANGTFMPMDILMLVADRRTKQLGDYNKSWLKATEENKKTLSEIRKCIESDDFNGYSENMLEFMYLMSPDMFDYFGMDSPVTFAKSKWGKKLIGAEDLSQFRSTLVSMVIEYRLSKSSKILTEISSVESDATSDIDALEALNAAFELEMSSLASSSMVWDTIAKESMEGNRVFLALIRDKGIKRWDSKARAFWNSDDALKYHSLITFLKSSELYETKVAVLADVTRVRQNYADITVDEIMGQLAHHPNRLHAGSRFDMDGGIRSEIDTMKESVDRISSYRDKTLKNIKEESERVIKEARKDKRAFEARLRRFSEDPGYMVHIDTLLAADAISSIYDKTYDDSEKIKQQPLVNGYFGSLSLQRSGGYFTHLQQTDNAVVNMVGFDQLTVNDIVMVLGNPEVEITVYDEFGTMTPISRSALCGGDTIDDVIEYLQKNPRVSLACRRFIAGVGSDVDGRAHMTAFNSLDRGDTHIDQVFSLLNDRPRFLAIAALCTPSSGNVGRNIVDKLSNNIEDICHFIAYESSNDKTLMDIFRDAEKFLGLKVDTVAELRKQGSFDGFSETDVDYAAMSLYAEVMREIAECVDVVQKSGLEFGEFRYQPLRGVDMGIDASSVVSYYDARQQLSGARTATMIGVEGSETGKNLVLKEYLKNRPDTYMMSEDGRTVIPVVSGLNPEDLSLEYSRNRQIGSICKFLEIKREKGAETYNAKSKKFGDDGTNSIIKFTKMGTRAMFDRFGKSESDTWSVEDGMDLLDKIAKCTQKHEAVKILAQALIEADQRLGYTDGVVFVESDYWNRADLMIAENEDGTFAVRTLEQLAVAMRNRLSDEAIASEDQATITAELNNIAQTLGTAADPFPFGKADVAYRCINNVNIHSSIGNAYRVDRALRPRSSSTERNYALMYKMLKKYERETGERYPILSQEELSKISKKKLDGKGSGVPSDIQYKLRKMKGYNFLGASYDSDLVLSPGPQNIVYFTGNSYHKAKEAQLLSTCEKLGITVCFELVSSNSDLFSDYADDILIMHETVNQDDYGDCLCIIPFFDMRLNGSMSNPIMPAPAQFPFSIDNVVTNVEDTTYEFKPGDATYHMTRELADRVNVNFRGDDQVFNRERLFPHFLSKYEDADFQMDFCTNEEIQKYIVNGEYKLADAEIDGFDKATVDIGVIPKNSNFERESERFSIRLQEYIDKFDSTDSEGFITTDCRYDSIVGFVKIVANANTVAFAPIWPFHLEESGSVPTTFKVDKVEFDTSSHAFNMSWRYAGDLEGQYIKAFEGIGASNKMIAGPEFAPSRKLQNGISVDGFYATNSVASRLFASNKRIHTMITLMMTPRVDRRYAYNFAELSGSFPGNIEFTRENGEVVNVKQALLDGDMSLFDWVSLRDQVDDIQYHVDPDINAIVKFWVNKCIDFGTVNPTILLATKTTNGVMNPTATEFECFMDTSLNFQNAMMKLMNAMQPTLCPESIDADSSQCLFKPVTNKVYEDYGVLQMLVPHFHSDGSEYLVPENVYMSFGFFGEEFSGFKKVNFDAYQRSIDSLNVSNNMNGFELSQMMSFGRSGMSSVTMSANMIQAVPDAIMEKHKAGE